ncbi:MAG: uroporphyrinogen-III synthase [Arenimonas sp.]
MREWTVLSLRPYGQHAVAHSASKVRGAKFLSCSSMKLEAIKNDGELKSSLTCNHIIVTSPAAARFAGRSPVFSVAEKSHWFALGEGTASVLKKMGVRNISMPCDGSNSENLLAMPELQDMNKQHVGLITAPGGRGLIEPALVKRGAQVFVAHTYQRKVLPVTAKQLQAIDNMPKPFAVLCSSHEVFRSLWQQITPVLQEKLRLGVWVLSSARLQDLLREDGILNSTVSPSPQPESMLEHLMHVQMLHVR